MKRTRELTGRAGVHAVGLIFTKQLGWIFREQYESDFGIDALVEVVDRDKATGKLFALQIKSGASYLRKKGDGYVYRGDRKHLTYWLSHCLPVFIVIHDPDTDLTIWQKIEKSRCTVTKTGWSTDIPRENVLDEKAKRVFLSTEEPTDEEKRRELFKWDIELIEAVQKYKTKFELDVDNDPEIGLTTIDIDCYDDAGEAVFRSYESYGGGAYTVHEVMQERYWFFNYEYAENVCQYEDSERHTLDVTVKPETVGYLAVEKILREGPPPTVEGETPYDDPPFDEEFQAILEQDQAAEQAYYDRDDSDGD